MKISTALRDSFEFVWSFAAWPHIIKFTPDMPKVLTLMMLTIVALLCQVVFMGTFVLVLSQYIDIKPQWAGLIMAAALMVYFAMNIAFNRIIKKRGVAK